MSASVGIVVERLFEIRKHTDRQLDWCSVWQFGKLELSPVSGSPVREYQILMHHQPHRRFGPDRTSPLDDTGVLRDLVPDPAIMSSGDIRSPRPRPPSPAPRPHELPPRTVARPAPHPHSTGGVRDN